MKQAYSVGELVKVLGKTYEIQQAELVRSAQFGNEPSVVYHLELVNGHEDAVVPEAWLVSLAIPKMKVC